MQKYLLYFDKPIDEVSVKSLLDKEFSPGEVELLKIDTDKKGIQFALINNISNVPIGVLKMLSNKKLSVISVVKNR